MNDTGQGPYERPNLKTRDSTLPRVNLRPFVFIALGLAFGILLYIRCRFGGAKGSDFVFFALLLVFSLRPLSCKRLGAILLCFCVAALAGAGLIHLKCESYRSGLPAGEYAVTGVVVSFTVEDGSTSLILNRVTLDEQSVGGRLSVRLPSEQVRAGDKVSFQADVTRSALPTDGSSYRESLFIKDIRYFATPTNASFSVMGRGNALLRLNAAVYDRLHSSLSKTQADTAYALLTGNAGSMDDSFTTAVRQGGVAHIFAVSGLHIGILYGAVAFVFRKLKRLSPIPALALVITYAAFCGFSVSSVRAVIMCAVLGIYGAIGRKYDFLSAIAFAATLVLLLRPAEWLSAGFRLSFGACVGLALYQTRLRHALTKMRLPRLISDYLAANLAVQLFTLPILFETFGYVSLWGTLLNLLLVPVLPVLFLGLIFSIALALIISPAAQVLLAVPNGMLSFFSWLFSFDFSLVITGFSLGAGGAVWTAGAVILSDRVRLGDKAKVYCSIFLTALTVLITVFTNAVFAGCKLITIDGAVLIETRYERVLVIDGSLSAASYQGFLNRSYGGRLTGVIVLNDNAGAGLSDALCLPADEVRASTKSETGFTELSVLYDSEFTYGELFFRFASKDKLMLFVENKTVEIDFTGDGALGCDLFVAGNDSAVYYLTDSAVYRTS